MKKILILFLFLFSTFNIAKAVEGEYRMGVEFGWSPVDLEAEKTAQELANLSGSTVTVVYDEGAFVGRIFSDYGITSDFSVEAGYFQTSSVDATYTISGDSATQSYEANGFDISGVVKDKSGFFGKAGIHYATVEGAASITIGSTTYSVTAEQDGTGPLIGFGYEEDNVRYSFTHYNDLGDTTDLSFFSVGFVF
jgi:hypothetical protein